MCLLKTNVEREFFLKGTNVFACLPLPIPRLISKDSLFGLSASPLIVERGHHRDCGAKLPSHVVDGLEYGDGTDTCGV